MQVLFGFVADHRVGGIDGFVDCGAGQAEQGEIEQRGDDAVGGVFGKGLYGGAGDFGLVEAVRVAPDDLADGAARALQAVEF